MRENRFLKILVKKYSRILTENEEECFVMEFPYLRAKFYAFCFLMTLSELSLTYTSWTLSLAIKDSVVIASEVLEKVLRKANWKSFSVFRWCLRR